MNILILSDAFWPEHTGGITQSLLPEVEGLAARGNRVVVVSRRLRQNFPLHESRDGYELYRYPSPAKGTAFYYFYPWFSHWQVPKLVARLHGEFHFEIAYVHNIFQAIGLSRCSQRIPYVYVFHAPTPQEIEIDATKGKYGLARPLVKVVNCWVKNKERQALTQAKRIIVRSKFMEKEMRQLYGEVGKDKSVCIPLCVDTQRFSFEENTWLIRDELGLPLDRPILLTVRRLVARMGLDNLITSVNFIAKQFPQILLLIGGKGYLENSLRQQVKELQLEGNVKFLGFISEEKLPKYYQAADIFVLPTMDLEGFGLVTLEALSCGVPVIATPAGANPEVLLPLGEEFLCKDITPEALAERITWFLKRGIGADLRRRCQDFCHANFEIEKITESIEKILKQVVEYDNK